MLDAAWKEYDATASWRQRRLRDKQKQNPGRKYISVNIDWSKVKFRDETEWPRIAEDMADGAAQAQDQNDSGHGEDSQMADFGRAQSSVLFQTKFTNNTLFDQEYTMKTEKTTRSSATTEIETSYTRGIEMSCNLKTPGEIFEANCGFTRELSLTNNETESIETELTWGVESLIKVKPEHIAFAQLVVNEKKYNGDFTITSRIKGYLSVEFRDVKEKVPSTFTVHNIAKVVEEHMQMKKRIGEPIEFAEVKDGVVIIRTKGTCNFRFGIRQEVVVNQVPLTGKK